MWRTADQTAAALRVKRKLQFEDLGTGVDLAIAHRHHAALSRSLIFVTLLLLVSSCARSDAAPVNLPPRPKLADVVATEYRFRLSTRQMPQGRTVFRVRNDGDLAHDLSLVRLPEDVPPIAEQLRSGDRRAVPTIARLAPRPPDDHDIFAVDLTIGRYAILCFIKDADDATHASKGMALEFRVGEPPRAQGGTK